MTETLHLFVGAILLIAFGLGFWLALPRDGKVRSLLRNDQVQAYYAVGVVSLLVGGVVNLLLVLMAMIGKAAPPSSLIFGLRVLTRRAWRP
jgi:sulfite exporter TauE/SafE